MTLARAACSLLLSLAACSSAPSPHATSSEQALGDGEPPDAILVLGHRPPLDQHGLEYETRARVDHGLALYREGRAPWLVFSGGPSTPEAVEADAMAAYAEQHGIPRAAIVRERASRDTIENARLSVSLLKATLRLTRAPRILLVTSDYHSERAARLFRCAGAEVTPAPVALELSESERAHRLRSERWVRFYYYFIDECNRAKASP
ncbi:MAG: hypothetical protein JWN04_4702 [Myxococcaceae bacterium]|nr:hypothetical protein [Myxococcaceae bacterium]